MLWGFFAYVLCFKYPQFGEDKSEDCYAPKFFETAVVTT